MRADFHLRTKIEENLWDFPTLLEKAKQVDLDWVVETNEDAAPVHFDSRRPVIYGFELTTDLVGIDVPVLAYFSKEVSVLKPFLLEQENRRQKRMARILKKLSLMDFYLNLGLDSSLSTLVNEIANQEHRAACQVYREYFSDKGIYYEMPIGYPTTQLVLEMIRDLGGIAIIAFPGNLAITPDLLRNLKYNGLSGLEVYVRGHTLNQVAFYERFCRDEDLLKTGGSAYSFEDFLLKRPYVLGSAQSFVQDSSLEKFLEALFC